MKWLARVCIALTTAALSPAATAAEIHGVVLADSITVEGKPLRLNGIGVRTKTILRIKVYVAGLYVETRSNSATRILAADAARRLELRMTHKSPRSRIMEELTNGFERNAKGKLAGLRGRFEKLLAATCDLSEGQALTLAYLPGRGTTIQCGNSKPVTLPGKDFADAAFSIWLGSDPLDEDLKQRLLSAG